MTSNHNDFLDATDDSREAERADFEQSDAEQVVRDQWGNPIVCDDEPEEPEFDDEPWDGFNSDAEADADALASAGWGTDEDYGGGCIHL